MGRHSCCYKQKLRKGLWSPEEDEKLINHITKYGHGCWSSVPKLAGLQRCGKSCRLRWINYLRPDLKRGTFSQEEENVIIELHAHLGNRWSQIAAQLPGRTDNEIKNLWNSSIKKKLRQKGIDPNTHKPLSETTAADQIEEKVVSGSVSVSGNSSKNNNIFNEKASETSISEQSFVVEAPETSNNLGLIGGMADNNNNNNNNHNNNSSTHEFFLNRFSTSCHESPTPTSTEIPSGFLSFQQLNYNGSSPNSNIGLSMNPNNNIFFNSVSKSSEMDFNSIHSITNRVMKQQQQQPPSIINFPTIETHMNPFSMFENLNNNGGFSTWAPSSTVKESSQMNHQHQEEEEVQEDVKWNEYMQTPWSNHDMYNETKSQATFVTTTESVANWHPQQQALQAENYQRLPATFGQFT